MIETTDENDQCPGISTDQFNSYTNCTGSGEINLTLQRHCCLPSDVRSMGLLYTSFVGIIDITGIVCNIFTIITFGYLCCFTERIKNKYNHYFSMVQDPVFYFILHLSVCDLLFCIFGIPSYWVIYFYGYFPFPENACKISTFVRNIIEITELNTLALISLYFAVRRGQGRPRPGTNSTRLWLLVLGGLLSVWLLSACFACIPLLGIGAMYGFDDSQGVCRIMKENNLATILMALGDVIPTTVVIISYGLVYTDLVNYQGVTGEQRRAVLVLTLCYLIFILPHQIFEALSAYIPKKALVSVIIHPWYFLVYIVNFFIYIIFWPRIRKAMQLLLADVVGKIGLGECRIWKKDIVADETETWWKELDNL